MPQPTRLFYDSEFTGLHQHTTLISLALVSEEGPEFYAEFSDYDREQCDGWIMRHVIAHTQLMQAMPDNTVRQDQLTVQCYGSTAFVREHLSQWLAQFKRIEIWADCLAYDWVLFCQLFGGALNLPENIDFMPYDLVTCFKLKQLDPDCQRSAYAQLEQSLPHNALSDARVVKACYQRLVQVSVPDG